MDFKFLLAAVNAKYIHSNPAIYSLRAYAGEELRRYVELAEYTVNQPMDEILADLYARKPDAIGFSCYIWNWRLVQELLAEIPKLLPDVRIWLGGPEVSYDADVILRQYPWLSGIMVGEGEATFRELLSYYTERADGRGAALRPAPDTAASEAVLAGGMMAPGYEGGKSGAMGAGRCTGMAEDFAGIKKAVLTEDFAGITEAVPAEDFAGIKEAVPAEDFAGMKEAVPAADFAAAEEPTVMGKDKGGRQRDVRAERLEDIPGLCLPTGYTPCRALTNLTDIPFLYDDLRPFENRILYYETSRGCPYRCSYCLSSIEKQVRLRDIKIVEKELQFFLDHNVKQVKFIDRTFNCSHSHTMAVWEYLKEHDNGVTNFHFEITADILREDEIALLNSLRPGLAQLEIGVQTVNPETLKAIRRATDTERLERTVAAIRRGGNIHLHLDLIAGLPYEDYDSFGRSFNRVCRMRPDQLQLGFLKVLKGSEMWERAEEYGIRYLDSPPYEVLYTKWLSYEDVQRLKRVEEMVELYYNSGQFTHTMPFLEKAFADPFAMYEALADFYEETESPPSGQSRSRCYTMLLIFAEKYDNVRQAVYRELLTYDMYLRENLKSRPDFAPDPADYKESIRDFYKKEEKKRTFLPEYEGYDRKQLARMTHLEPFRFPVWDTGRMLDGYEEWEEGPAGNDGGSSERKAFVLFDYRKRSPLDHSAGTTILEAGSVFGTSGIESL